jgi:hypothetical protein
MNLLTDTAKIDKVALLCDYNKSLYALFHRN